MKKYFSVLLVVTALLLLSACSSRTVTNELAVQTVDAAADLATLDQSYSIARDSLLKNQGSLPPDVAAELVPLVDDVDAYADRLRTLWRNDKALLIEQAERIYIEGQALYERGVALIEPHYDELPGVVRYDLRHLSDSLLDIGNAVEYYKANPQAAQQAQLYGSGIRLAIALLRIGGVLVK